MNASTNPDLVVVDLARVPAWLRLDLKTIAYRGIISSEVLAHLTSCAREREARDADKLAAILYGEQVTA